MGDTMKHMGIMKRIFAAITACLVIFSSAVCANAAEVSVGAQTAVLYCPDNEQVFFSKNPNKKMRPASTTKLMTALLTLEYAAEDNKQVKFTREMIAEGSSMYLKVGEVVTLRDLAAGLMMCSGNDAANAAAISIDGSLEKFSDRMNKRAEEIGMKNTHFVTPSGLDDDDHYTTAYDLALLMSAALKNDEFRKLTCERSDTVNFIKPKNKVVTYSNHNRLLSMYGYCIGGKTGYTMAAGRCLVTAAQKDGLTLVSVTLNDRNDWNDHIALYDYGFERYMMKCLDDTDFYTDVGAVGGEYDKITVGSNDVTNVVVSSEDYDRVERSIYMDNFLYAPIREGDVAGKVLYTLDDKVLAEHKLVSMSKNNSLKENKSLWDFIKGIFNNAL